MVAHVTVSNLGPLKSAEVDITDLTILVGDNNTGKTFFATLIHQILKGTASSYWASRSLLGRRSDSVSEFFSEMLTRWNHEPEFCDVYLDHIPHDVLSWLTEISEMALTAYAETLRESIEYAFSTEISEIRRRTAKRRTSRCWLSIENTTPAWKVNIRFDSDEIFVETPDPLKLIEHVSKNYRTIYDQMSPDEQQYLTSHSRWLLEDIFLGTHAYDWDRNERPPQYLFPNWPNMTLYVPANRAGIMQSYQVLASSIVRQSVMAGINRIEVGSFPGITADFLSYFLSPDDDYHRGRSGGEQVKSLVDKFEKSLRARIVRQKRPDSADSFVADTPEGIFPFTRTSSMISELAPILLMLKETVRPGDHITIDEPEAHLHPAIQRQMALFVANLVDLGIRVALTTHSDFFVGEINNIIRRYSKKEFLGRENRKKQPMLDPNRIRALRFYRDEERGCFGVPLSIERLSGVDESTFADVIEDLYDDSAVLMDELMQEQLSGTREFSP